MTRAKPNGDTPVCRLIKTLFFFSAGETLQKTR